MPHKQTELSSVHAQSLTSRNPVVKNIGKKSFESTAFKLPKVFPFIDEEKEIKKITSLPEFKISFKYKKRQQQTFKIIDFMSAAKAARACFKADNIEWYESFIVIALTRSNNVIGFYKVSSGGVSQSIADPKIILQFALLSNASALILAHNHPSDNIYPSSADEEVTQRIEAAAALHDIKVLDHIIVTNNAAWSMKANERVLFN